MSLTTSLHSAFSGLTATTRGTEVVSSNIANAKTEGYGVRELVLASRATGQGVAVVGVSRQTDAAVIGERRTAQAEAGQDDKRATFLLRYENALGAAEADGSLTDRIADFDSALVAAAASPESDAALSDVLTAANGVASALTDASGDIQSARAEADADIAAQVKRLNAALTQIARLNSTIVKASAQGRDTSDLLDQRQKAIDGIADIAPLREVPRENGQVSLYTAGGTLLVEGTRASEIGFQAVGAITPDMTLASGALSGLSVNGKPVSTRDSGSFGGGTLTAAFAVRDDLAPQAQADLDAMARDLIERFQGLDPTLAATDAGLFTDAGNAFSATGEAGLAGRIAVNSAADPDQGGALWRLRDGLGATAAGAAGDSSLLIAIDGALTEIRATASGSLVPGNRSFGGLAGAMLSSASAGRLAAESRTSQSAARLETLRSDEAAGGVDTDIQLQTLLALEQAYSANAKVIQTVDSMIQSLLEI